MDCPNAWGSDVPTALPHMLSLPGFSPRAGGSLLQLHAPHPFPFGGWNEATAVPALGENLGQKRLDQSLGTVVPPPGSNAQDMPLVQIHLVLKELIQLEL